VSRRESILAFLKTRGEASLDEVASSLGVSKQGALRHLELLRTEGFVDVRAHARDGRPGRPEHVYRLTAAAAGNFPQGHRELASDLVHFIGREQLREFFEQRAARLEAASTARMAGKNLRGRVEELARIATENGHMATVVELDDGSLAIRQCNCPIGDVAAETRQPCQAEHALYQRLLGVELERTSFMPEAASSCTYVVRGRASGKNKVTGRRHSAAAR
jgi:predicted ArsR family transcriptional regulator